MNDETVQATESTVSETTATESTETAATEAADGVVETQTITIQEIQSIGSDIVHADLFGSFLICGTLVGIALLRRIYGT